MANLYQIENEILNCVDMETGEIIDFDRLAELQLERTAKIENLALWYKNLMSDMEAYKKEKNVFAEREKAAKNKAESIKKYLADVLSGQPMKTERVSVSFRKSEAVSIDDESAFIDYAQKHNHEDLLTFKAPEINKTAIKQAIKDGEEIPGAEIVVKSNIQIK